MRLLLMNYIKKLENYHIIITDLLSNKILILYYIYYNLIKYTYNNNKND